MIHGNILFKAGRAFGCDRLGLRRRLCCSKGICEARASMEDLTSMSAAQTINFLTLVQQLKVGRLHQRRFSLQLSTSLDDTLIWVQVTKRTGWVRKGVQGPESIADHMYRMGIMALIAEQPGLNSTKCDSQKYRL
jgi:hypothetical protein